MSKLALRPHNCTAIDLGSTVQYLLKKKKSFLACYKKTPYVPVHENKHIESW